MNLSFTAQGVVGLTCDVSNEVFDFQLDSKLDWIVKFGDEYDDDHDEFLILPHGSYQVDVAQPIYEMIALSVPQKSSSWRARRFTRFCIIKQSKNYNPKRRSWKTTIHDGIN